MYAFSEAIITAFISNLSVGVTIAFVFKKKQQQQQEQPPRQGAAAASPVYLASMIGHRAVCQPDRSSYGSEIAQVAVRLQGAFAQSQIGIHFRMLHERGRPADPLYLPALVAHSVRVLGGIGVGWVARLLLLVGPLARVRPRGSRSCGGVRLGVAMRRGRGRRVELPGGVDAAVLGAGAYFPALATSVARAREYVPLHPAKRKHP